LILAPVASENISSSLKLLIKDHHSKFVKLYGLSAYTPKASFFDSLPGEQLLNLGPMVRTWTMRYEAKLNFFKQSSRHSNFKKMLIA